MIEQLLIGFLLAIVISVSSYFFRLLTLSGSIAQCILGTILLGLGGWQWTVPMLVFFVFSSVISKLGKRRRGCTELFFEKSSRRDAWQVIANGGVAEQLRLSGFSQSMNCCTSLTSVLLRLQPPTRGGQRLAHSHAHHRFLSRHSGKLKQEDRERFHF